MRSILTILSLVAVVFLGGCATPLGQQYGVIGAAGGAVIGGAMTGDVGGAAIGAAIGALGGGALGDQQTFDNQRHHGRHYQDRRYYPRPCREFREPVYDYYGYVVGYRRTCR